MLRRVNPIMLLGLIIVLVLSLGIFARAQMGGGTASDAIGVGEAQIGKPFAMATDGPNSFSCAGLIRHILRTIGVDANAPWSAEGMLTAYPAVDPANLQPGDLMLWPDHATMYVGNGMVLNANQVEGLVTHTPVDALGPPMGIVRPPYGGGGGQPLPADPAATQPLPTDPAATGPAAQQYGIGGPAAQQYGIGGPAAQQYGTDPLAQPLPADTGAPTTNQMELGAGLDAELGQTELGAGLNAGLDQTGLNPITPEF